MFTYSKEYECARQSKHPLNQLTAGNKSIRKVVWKMARKPMVTRTIVTTKCNVLCLNITTGEPFNQLVTLPRTYKDEKKLLKKVEEIINTEDVKAVHIVDTTEVETLYGMTEQHFIENAEILDPATRKVVETEKETTDAE